MNKVFEPRTIMVNTYNTLIAMSKDGYAIADSTLRSLRQVLNGADDKRMAKYTMRPTKQKDEFQDDMKRRLSAMKSRLESYLEEIGLTKEEREYLDTMTDIPEMKE